MLKASVFALGITTGVYLGIKLREQGFSSGLTRAYYAYQNPDYGRRKYTPPKQTFDDVMEYFNAGLLQGEDLEKFKEILKTKRYDKVNEIVLRDVDKMFEKENYFAEMRKEYGAQNKK